MKKFAKSKLILLLSIFLCAFTASGQSAPESNTNLTVPGSSANGGEKFPEPFKRNLYDAFPSVVQYKQTNYLFVKSGGGHAIDGQISLSKSTNGGAWTSPVNIKINNLQLDDAESVSAGVAKNGRLVIAFTRGVDNYSKIHYAYSNARDENFINASVAAFPDSLERGAPHDGIRILPSGRLLSVAFAYKNAVKAAKVYLNKSDDDGATWSYYSTIIDGVIGSTALYSEHGWVNEATVATVNDAKTDEATKMLAVVRTESHAGYHIQLSSENGGLTWTNRTDLVKTTAFGEANGDPPSIGVAYPIALHRVGEYMYAFAGYRNQLPSGERRTAIRYWKAKALDVYAAPGDASWGAFRTIHRGKSAEKAWLNDYGYPAPFGTANGNLKIAFYDVPADFVSNGNPAGSTRIIVMPVADNYFFDAFATINQSIQNNTETAIATPEIWLDSELYYNRSTQKRIIQSEGWYRFDAIAQIETATSGNWTFRIEAIEADAVAGRISKNAVRTIAADSKPIHASNPRLNRISLSRSRYYCRKGEEIRLYVEQDSGRELKVINTNAESRATLRFKKIK